MNAWTRNADVLSQWVWDRLVNRTDVWGLYHRWTDREGVVHHVRTAPWRRQRGHVTLGLGVIRPHFADPGDGRTIGLHSTSEDGACRWIAWDIDRHDDDDPTPANVYEAAAIMLYGKLWEMGFRPLLEDSNGVGGFHIWLLFDSPVPVADAHAFARSVVADHESLGLPVVPETYPKQPDLAGGFGNWLRVPGEHHSREHRSRFYDGWSWLDGEQAVKHLLNAPINAASLVPAAPPPPPEPELGKAPTCRAMTGLYRGRLQSATCEAASRSDAIGSRMRFTCDESWSGQNWVSCSPIVATGVFYVVGRDGQANRKVGNMLHAALGWCGDVDELFGLVGWQPPACQVVVEAGNDGPVAKWLRSRDAEVSGREGSYLSKLPTGLQAGQQRSNVAYRFAAFLAHDCGRDDSDCMRFLQHWNGRQATPLPESKLKTTIDNVKRYGGRARRSAQ